MVHWYHRIRAWPKHTFPLFFTDVFAMVGSSDGLANPSLLVGGSWVVIGDFHSAEIVEIAEDQG
jgi:hypothetical protein